MKQAVIYTRFSPRPSAKDCTSCEFQEQKCRDYCALHGMDVLAVYQDRCISGKRADNRPGLQAALVHVCKEKGVLVVYAFARLARSTMDAIKIAGILEKQKADLASVSECIDTSSAMGRAVYRIMAVFAELERETTGERTREKLRAMQDEGKRVTSGPRYGLMVDPNDPRRVIKNKHEQSIVDLIMRYHAQGINFAQIGRELDKLGFHARGAGGWYSQTIKRIINRNL